VQDWGSSGRRFKSCQPDLVKYALSCCDVLSGGSDDPELGTILGPQVLRQQLTGTRNRLAIRVQVTLRRAQVSVAGDLPEYMHGHAGVSHPRQPCVPQAVTLELLVAKFGDDLVPASCIPERGRGDPPTPGSGEQAGVGVTTGHVDSSLNKVADGVDQWNLARPPSLGVLVDQAAAGCRGASVL
jgi:hypothetical protein